MKKIQLTAFCLMVFAINSFAQQQYDFAVYYDYRNEVVGAWGASIKAFSKFLEWKGVSYKKVDAAYINNNKLEGVFKAIYFPGGDCDGYNEDINDKGKQNIRDLVANDGAYIGVCAGAEFACDKLIWKGVEYDHGLDLFKGVAIGPIDVIAKYPKYAMSTFSMNLKHPINKFETMFGYGPDKNKEDVLYFGGCVYQAYTGTTFETVATFDAYKNEAGMLTFNYGTGRVLLISPHPEIEENSDRDGGKFGETLNDHGSDWNFLWPATDWLLGKPITYPLFLGINTSSQFNVTVRVNPNPTSGTLTLLKKNKEQQTYHLSIKDIQGKEIISKDIQFEDSYSLQLNDMDNGIYYLMLQNNKEQILQKIVLQK
jgi:glutamine amidotransferase-like uncharacterized protein